MPNTYSPDSRVIMISGGNRGIGAALARRFSAGGWRISLGVRDPSAPSTGETPANAFVAHYEAQELPTAASWVEATVAQYGRIDALVCNAGTADTVTLENGTPEQFDRMSAINTRAPFFLTQAAWPALKVGGHGRVVIVSSLSGKRARNLNAGYQVTKFAAVGLAHAIRRTGWDSGIRCTAVCPGYVRTRMGLQSGTVDPAAVTDPDELAGLVHEIVNLSNTASVAELVVNCAFEPVY